MAAKQQRKQLYFSSTEQGYGALFWLLICCVTIVSLLIVAALYFKQEDEYAANAAIHDKLAMQYADLLNDKEQLQRRELNADSKEYIEQLARSELNMVKPGDRVYLEKED